MKKVLVTGGMGFIGYHLCEKLLNEGVEVTVVDNYQSLERENIKEEMLLSIGRNANFLYINKRFGDIFSDKLLDGIDCVYHLAVPMLPRSWDGFGTIIYSHIAEAKTLITKCKDKGIPIIYTSSIEVYGPRFGMISEETPRTPATKLGLLKTAEEAMFYKELNGRAECLCVLRLPTVYGPWQGKEMTYHQLLLSQIKGKTNEIVEDSCKDDVVYIEDVIEILWRAGKDKALYGVYNVGSGEKGQWEKGVGIISTAYLQSLTKKLLTVEVSVNKLKKKFHYSPSTSLQAGLKKQKEHIKKMYQMKRLYS